MFCKLNAQAKNGNESKLFKDLNKQLKDRTLAKAIYAVAINSEFQAINANQLIYDNNNEPTIESILPLLKTEVLKTTDIERAQLEQTLMQKSYPTILDAVQAAVEFNQTHTDYVATITKFQKNAPQFTVERLNENSKQKRNQLERSYKTYQQISNFLDTLGLKINILDANLFHGEDGLVVPEHLQQTVGGLFGALNIANSLEGFQVVTEEFAHFVLENLSENPIVQRAEQMLRNNTDLVKEILSDDYNEVVTYYQQRGQVHLVEKEALGRLCAHLLNGDESATNNNLFIRVGQTVKNFINRIFKLNTNQKYQEYSQLKQQLEKLLKDTFAGKTINQQTLEHFNKYGNMLAHTQVAANQVSAQVQALQESIVGNLIHYLSVYENTEDLKIIDAVKEQLRHLNTAYTQTQFLTGTVQYLKELLNISKTNLHDLQTLSLKGNPTLYDLRSHAHTLLQLRNLIQSYREPLQDLSTVCQEILTDTLTLPEMSKTEAQAVYDLITQCTTLLNQQEERYFIFQKHIIKSLCMPYFGVDGTLKVRDFHPLANEDGIITLETVLDWSVGDISMYNRLLVSAANTDDLFIQLLDKIIKDQQEHIRAKTLQFDHRIQELDAKYRKSAGFKGYDFMFGHDTDNKLNGKYNLYNWSQFEKDRQNYIKTHGSDQGFVQNNTQIITIQKTEYVDLQGKKHTYATPLERSYRVPIDKYKTDRSSWTTEQCEYMDEFIQLKTELDWLLPARFFNPTKCIQMMVSSTGEAILNSESGLIGGIENALHSLKTNYLSISDNDNGEFFGNGDNQPDFLQRFIQRWKQKTSSEPKEIHIKTNFDRTPYREVPVYFVQTLDDMTKLSRDATSTLREYCIMAQHYSGMHKIIDTVELMRDRAKLHNIVKVNGRSRLRQILSTVEVNTQIERDVLENTEATNWLKRVNTLIDTQVYNQSKNQGMSIFGVPVGKLSDDLIKFTALSLLGYSAFSGINNVVVAKYQMFIESMGGRNFNWTEFKWADLEYLKELPHMLPELFSTQTVSKLSLIGEMFNVGQHWKENIKKSKSYRNNIEQFLSNLGPSFLLESGEHQIQMSTALAYLKHTKLYRTQPEFDETGKLINENDTISLYDALTVEQTKDANGHVINAQLILKPEYENYVQKNGKKYYLHYGSTDVKRDTLRIGKINQDMHGIYNAEDQVEAKRTALGRMALMFRNHIVPQIQKRYKSAFKNHQIYNFISDEWEEGYIVTAVKTLCKLFKTQTDNKFDIVAKYKIVSASLSKYEKANLKKALGEISALTGIFLLLTFVIGGWDDDDDWIKRQVSYYVKRLQLEAEFPYKPISNGMSILVSPSAVISPLQRWSRVFQDIGRADKILQTGPYKGHSVLYADIMRAMPILPQVKDFIFIDEDNRRFKMFDTNNTHLLENIIVDEN